MDVSKVRSSAVVIAKFATNLLSEATIAAERSAVPESSVYREGALFHIRAVRRELDELEAELTAPTLAMAATG